MMRLSFAAFSASLMAAACAIGPGYHRPDVQAPPQYRAPSASEDSMRGVYGALAASRDSMASRRPDTAGFESAARGHAQTRLNFELPNAAETVSGFDLFQDSVLKQRVRETVAEPVTGQPAVLAETDQPGQAQHLQPVRHLIVVDV